MSRGGAAAAAGNANSAGNEPGDILGKFLVRDIIDRCPVFRSGQPGIGLQQHWDRGILQIAFHNGRQRLGAQGTVDTDGIGTHAFQHGHHSFRAGPGHELAVLAVGVGHKYGKPAVFLGSQQRSLCFIAVIHGLNENEIGTVLHTKADGFSENGHRIFKVQIAVGLQQTAKGPDIQSGQLGLGSGALGSGLSYGGHGGPDDGIQLL